MNKEEILKKVNEIFADAFDRENLVVGLETTSLDLEGWDSLMQMNLIEMIEDEFDIRFDMADIIGIENVGSMIDLILKKIK